MLCPYCNNETKKGKMTFMGLQGFVPMIGTFNAETDEGQGIFSKKTKEAVILQGFENEAYYCENCSLVFPAIKIK